MPYIPTEKVVLNSAREEVDYRLKNQIAAVRSVPERQAVLNVRKQIVEGRKFPAQSDALRGHFKDMADVLAGPFPALARVEAARAVGEAIVKDNSLAVHPEFLRILQGMQTAPDLREGPIEHGAWLEAIGKTPDFLKGELTSAVAHDNQNDAKRLALSMAAMEVFAELKGAFLDMDIPEWTRMNIKLSVSGEDREEGETRPKCVIRMGSREVTQVDDRGIVEHGTRLPTRKSMAIVAHLGVPIHGRFNIGGESDQRNLSILLAEPKLATRKVEADDMQLEKWRGIRLPALDIPSEESFGEMKKTLEETGNCLLPQVLRLVSSGTLPWNLAIRISRELHNSFDTQTDRRQALPKVLSRHLARLQQPVVLEKWRDGKQVGSESTTILTSHVDEFNNRICGLLNGKKVTEETTLEILETTATAILCTKEPDGDLNIVRSEPELVRVLEMLMKRWMLPEDKKRYPTLIGGAGQMKAETIRSESTPLKVLPEMIRE
ncbi:MAG: hypothetical protein AABZ46_03820 [Nitrospirota bacterium]